MANRRALHFVFKIGNRKETANFYRNVLGMKVLRHEEFEEGCKAYCNGPYDGKWSKTMIGYGPEDNHFVCELTYNYGIGEYKLGNDFLGISISSKTAVTNGKQLAHTVGADGSIEIEAPGGYKYFLSDCDASTDPVQMVTLGCSNLTKSTEYWTKICGMKVLSQTDKSATFGYNAEQASLKLVDLGCEIDHKTAFGRIAISCPRDQLSGIRQAQKESGNKIVMDLVSLDTPGKATVEVVILADPDGHEICFVGDEAFKELSQVDPNGDKLLNEGIELDKSDEWYAKHNKTKASA